MRLRKPCEHGRYELHPTPPDLVFSRCPGGEFLAEGAELIERVAAALEDEKRITDPDFDDYTIEVNSANFAAIYQIASRYLDALASQVGESER